MWYNFSLCVIVTNRKDRPFNNSNWSEYLHQVTILKIQTNENILKEEIRKQHTIISYLARMKFSS